MSLTTALARKIRSSLSAGFSLAYQDVTIAGYDHIGGELLIGAALNASLAERVDVALWYSGQTLGRKRAYGSLARQMFQLGVISRVGDSVSLTLAVEKTPPFSLRQLLEVTLVTPRDVTFLLGYRTNPSLPCVGVQVPLRRLLLSMRLNLHPIFGFSTAFGFSFQ